MSTAPFGEFSQRSLDKHWLRATSTKTLKYVMLNAITVESRRTQSEQLVLIPRINVAF